ncbi:MAG: 16S rRNA (guanine(966)-N(2))-methyltransferase RsmD [Colwellia sp.]
MPKQIKKNLNKPSKPGAMGSVRLISGKHKGRKLPVILAKGLRPTTDRVKETVFSWLMPYMHSSRCLDCFAGSGSLGFEALSRGASEVTLLELNRQAAEQLKKNKALLKADNLTIHQTDSLEFLQNPITSFDIVFIDPPFNKELVDQTISRLNNGWLAENAIIYIEMELNGQFDIPQDWSLLKEKTAGQVTYRLFEKN